MTSSLLSRIASKIARRNIQIDDQVPFFYLFGIVLEHAFALLRSMRYIGFSGISSGRFFLGRGVVIKCCSKVRVEKGCRIGDRVFLDGYSRGGLFIGSGSSIGAYSRLICSGSISSRGEYIRIGRRVGIAEFARIGGSGGVEIGDDTIIAQYFSAHPENHNFLDKSLLIRSQGTTRAPIQIGSNCWIGAKVTITAGVRIGNGVIIGSGAVVTKDLPDYCVAGGVPARIIRMY